MASAALIYAHALMDIAGDKTEDFSASLKTVSEVLTQSRELKTFLNNKTIEKHIRKQTILLLFGESIERKLVNLLLLLTDKEHIASIGSIYHEFVRLANKKYNIINIDIITANMLSGETIRKIEEKYKKRYGARSVKSNVFVEPDILGGLIIKIGNTLIDSSLKSALDGLNKSITAESSISQGGKVWKRG